MSKARDQERQLLRRAGAASFESRLASRDEGSRGVAEAQNKDRTWMRREEERRRMNGFDISGDKRTISSMLLKRSGHDLRPDIDVFEDEDCVYITLDAVHFNEEDVELELSSRIAIISIETEKLRFRKELILPSKVDPESAVRTYRNGVLDVSVKKSE